uniref:Uncharacterized protein n=1 Tax=Cucumis melo TaxID=3656 RepID=A0A9I9CCH6_CUCME
MVETARGWIARVILQSKSNASGGWWREKTATISWWREKSIYG